MMWTDAIIVQPPSIDPSGGDNKLPKGAMSSELHDLSYVVLNLIGRNGAGPHDLVNMARRGQRLYWAGAESKIYAEPKRLERLGYLTSQKTPGKTRERTHYRLTEKGLRAIQDWLALPSRFPRIQSEAAIRIQASDLANDPTVVLASLGALRDEIAELSALLDQSEQREPDFPHRRTQLRLLRSLGRRILRAHLEWIEEVEDELGSLPPQPDSRPTSR
jgi:DNA-binding PadR family transcriptional regulator